ncbi:CvpA family protein [Pararhodospirillum oryzae]|uniref:Colicin V biosynthesis protein n=1 Tax=Pararhodospirillum oryzae TaxID=478448 RepID=A0A512HA97_9PROT|nr:CvpA family protein [Pararhodospirillum oryzae]GEO82376.1 colicin V biosynthesis protein [Pararhodospirillum oryzae]
MTGWPINPVDLVVLAVLLLSAVLAFMRGFVHEVLGIAAWVGAATVALAGHKALAPLMRGLVPGSADWVAEAAAGAVLFLATLILLFILTGAIARQVRKTALNTLDRSLGFLFGLARGALILIALSIGVTWLMPPDRRPEWVRAAASMPILDRGTRIALEVLPEPLRGRTHDIGTQAGAAADRVEDLLDTGRAVQDVQSHFERLADPQPQAPQTDATGPVGYGNGQRRDLDRLIESTR